MPSWLERLRDSLAPGIAVEREIASGGMGHVALGWDTLLHRVVAIKVLRPEKASAIAAERFVREARNAAALRHPNVVQVHHAGEAGGLFYYTMDYADGETLAERLERGHMSPSEVLALGRDLLTALGAAHDRNLIHRDVKPSNIFLTCNSALLGDFGIAYDLDSTRTELTRSGELVGTPAYITPEQLHDGPITPVTDIYAAGLVLYEAVAGRRWMPQSDPERGDWSRVPEPLRGPIRRALRIDPTHRWPNAAAFADALSASGAALGRPAAPRRLRVRRAALAIAGAAATVAAVAWYRSAPPPQQLDLVIYPFESAGGVDSSVGTELSWLTGRSLEQLTDLRLAPSQVAKRRWRSSSLGQERRLVELTRTLPSRYGAWAYVVPRGARLEVRLSLVGSNGKPLPQYVVVGDTTDLSLLADAVAMNITRVLFSRRQLRPQRHIARVPVGALAEFLVGEDAFARDAWLTAERHYSRALALDSSFVLAAWRLGNARRWMPLRSKAYPPGLYRLFDSQRETLAEVDRHLIEAQFRPSGTPRFEEYEKALATASGDPYAPLLYGDELFHRGPLAGRPLGDAVRLLEQAVVMDSTLAPAWEHLAWALIRLGQEERAGRALASLESLAGRPDQSEIYLPRFLRIAHTLRFGSPAERVEAQDRLGRDPGALALAARGALSFDLPEAQAALGAALGAGGGTPALQASGLTALGVALFALGRPGAAVAAFDSAATRFPHPAEARLQAAEWRVVPGALGVAGVDDGERLRGRAALAGLVGDSLLGPRAAWALTLDAHASDDTVAAQRWAARVRGSGAPNDRRLVPLLDGLSHAARRKWADALATSEPALAYDSAGYAPDPFLRAALHLLRGEWLVRLGRLEAADSAWLWYENLDVRGWPDAEAQPAEVDWALATHGRMRRARLATDAGGTSVGCALGRRARQIWVEAEPAVLARLDDLERVERRCPM
jgi:tetratricopeptide (TPR) repeat protein